MAHEKHGIDGDLDGGGRVAHRLRGGVVDIGELGAIDSADDPCLPHDICGEPERGAAECIQTIQVLLAEMNVDGAEVVSELLFGAGRDQRNDRTGLLPNPGYGHLCGWAVDFAGDGDDLADDV